MHKRIHKRMHKRIYIFFSLFCSYINFSFLNKSERTFHYSDLDFKTPTNNLITPAISWQAN